MMRKASRRARRLAFATGFVGIVSAVALTLLPSAMGSSSSHGLYLFVVPNNQGPVTACYDPSGTTCPASTMIRHFLYVANTNPLTNFTDRPATRESVPNAFVINSVDETITVNGALLFSGTWTPPPNANLRSWSGHWPSTVTCPAIPGPCNVVGNPAILPGENTVALFVNWIHGSNEPDGRYVFSFTVHGTLNGTPVDLSASGPPVNMTR
jgi:hypothetical protein